MRSPRGFVAALVLLLSLPVTLLYAVFFPKGVDTISHLALALGLVLIAFAVFDFQIPRWIMWIGCVSTSALAGVLLLQGVSELIPNESLAYVAYQVLGQRLEAWLVDVFLLWCIAVLLVDSRGKTRILGFLAMSLVACLELYSRVLWYRGSSLSAEAPSLKVLYLLPFVWLLFESKKPSPRQTESAGLIDVVSSR